VGAVAATPLKPWLEGVLYGGATGAHAGCEAPAASTASTAYAEKRLEVAPAEATPIKAAATERATGVLARVAAPASFVLATALLALCFLTLSSGAYNPFIYFRF
jgi:hypothetical protein